MEKTEKRNIKTSDGVDLYYLGTQNEHHIRSKQPLDDYLEPLRTTKTRIIRFSQHIYYEDLK